MAQITHFVNRKGWERGPWDDEPDVIHIPPILLHRQSSGGWGAMVAVDKKQKANVAYFIRRQGEVKLDNRLHTLSMIEFDKHSRAADAVDTTRLYVGFFYNTPGEMRPDGTKFITDMPVNMRPIFMGKVKEEYVTAERATMYAQVLARVLNDVGIPPIDSST